MQHEAVSALPKIITTGFRSIQLIYFFTAGEDEVKCWQIRKGTKAPQVCNGAAYFSLSQEKHGSSQGSWTVHWSFHYSLINSITQQQYSMPLMNEGAKMVLRRLYASPDSQGHDGFPGALQIVAASWAKLYCIIYVCCAGGRSHPYRL